MKVTREIRLEIIQRFNDGELMKSISSDLDISRTHVSRILSEQDRNLVNKGGGGKKPKYVGKKFVSDRFGIYEVLEYLSDIKKYRIKFLDTDSIIETDGIQIKNNSVFNHYAPTFMNFGILGESFGKAKQSPVFGTWQHMIDRCLNTRNKRHEGYTPDMICDEWANFTTFEKDVKDIPFYEQRIKEGGNKWNLDKDILGQRRYSKNTCLWIPQAMNVHISGIYRMIDMGFDIKYPTREQIIEYIKNNYIKE